MDPLTAFVIAALMMLLNGGMLGLMHNDLVASLRPAADSWRISTLLMAGGCILLAVQQWADPAWLLPLANGMLLLGLAGYWRALRQFYGLPERGWLLVPVLICAVGIWWFAAIAPDLPARVLIASTGWCVLLGGAVWTLWKAPGQDPARSRRVLAVVFLIVVVFMAIRALFFVVRPNAARSIVDTASWVNMVSPLVAAILPVIGTTCFLLLCNERIRRQWETAASTDALTGLPNRRTLMSEALARLRDGRLGGVAMIDIDHFKSVNDRFGHEVGDAVLRHVALRIAAASPADAIAARLGGEEFALLFDTTAAGSLDQLGERVRAQVAEALFTAGAVQLSPRISVGVAPRGPAGEDLQTLLRRADEALYAAKARGRDRVVVWTAREQAA